MSSVAAQLQRPQRWDAPFGPELTDDDVDKILRIPEVAAIDADRFPKSLPLRGILRNDCRFVQHAAGEIIVRDGDYGSSAFLIVSGSAKVVLPPGVPPEMLGRRVVKRKGLWESFSQLWRNPDVPEARDISRYLAQRSGQAGNAEKAHDDLLGTVVIDRSADAMVDEQTLALRQLLEQLHTVPLPRGSLFGEIAALRREPRSATIVADAPTLLLEIRWQGLRDIRKYDAGWRAIIDQSYRKNTLATYLREHPLFARLDEAALQRLADQTLFETFGSFEWFTEFNRRGGDAVDPGNEPIVAAEGDYSDGLLLIAAGFGRVTKRIGNGRRTLTYLRAGDGFGVEEMQQAQHSGQETGFMTSLHAVGYLDVLRIPAQALVGLDVAWDKLPDATYSVIAERPVGEGDSLLEWAVQERFINGTQAMFIDLDRCVRCDDCVRACSVAHLGNPRFLRHGKTFGKWMVANACMHCSDPVCLIGCPTGAIHRAAADGVVTINDDTCIGCGVCANSCPYSNIRLVEIADKKGRMVLDPDTQTPILKATKCDLCVDQPTGPACVRACPHDALERVDLRNSALLGGG